MSRLKKEILSKLKEYAGKMGKDHLGGDDSPSPKRGGLRDFDGYDNVDYNKDMPMDEAYVVLYSPKKGVKPVSTAAYRDKKDAEKWAKDLGGITMIVKKKIKGVDEAKLSTIHKAAKKGSYPVSLVVIKNGKVIKQVLNIKTPAEVPAAFNVVKNYHKHKDATVHIEDRTGKRLFSEACWKGYKEVGGKIKNGKQVPNCVPESIEEDSPESAHPQGSKKLSGRTTVMDMLDVISHKEFGPDYHKLSTKQKKEVHKLAIKGKLIKQSPFKESISPRIGKLLDKLVGGFPYILKNSGKLLIIREPMDRMTFNRMSKNFKSMGYNPTKDMKGNFMVHLESVNEGVSVSDERHFGKKGIIIMIDDNGKKVSAIFKDKKNADKFNRNNPSDIKKLLQLAKKTKYPKAIDESVNEARYYITRNLGRGQGKALVKHYDRKKNQTTDKPKEFKSYKDAQKEVEKLQKGGSMGGQMTAYIITDKNMKPLKESVNESMFSLIDQIRQDSKDVRDFVKNVFKDREFKKMSNDKEFIKYLKSIYEGVDESKGVPSNYMQGRTSDYHTALRGKNRDYSGGTNFKKKNHGQPDVEEEDEDQETNQLSNKQIHVKAKLKVAESGKKKSEKNYKDWKSSRLRKEISKKLKEYGQRLDLSFIEDEEAKLDGTYPSTDAIDRDIDEKVDNHYLKNAKKLLKDPHTIKDIEYNKTRRGDKFVKIIYTKDYVRGKMMDTGPHFVSVFYEDEKDLQIIGKALKLKLKEGMDMLDQAFLKAKPIDKEIDETAKRDYKDEYKKFQSSKKSKKYRAELNKYNRQKGTYGNGDGKDASHKGGKIVGFESASKNRGRKEKSRLKKK